MDRGNYVFGERGRYSEDGRCGCRGDDGRESCLRRNRPDRLHSRVIVRSRR
jgi:hypothetical protein